MKYRWLFTGAMVTAAFLLMVGILREPVHAQGQQDGQGLRIACLDVSEVFKNYQKFKSQREVLKSEVESGDDELQQTQQEVQALVDQLKVLTNQNDRDNIEKEINEKKFQFEKRRRNLQQAFIQKEADIYATIYKEVVDLVTRTCEHNGIHIVFRIREDMTDAGNPQHILQTINREVVYYQNDLDITQLIIDGLNQKFAK